MFETIPTSRPDTPLLDNINDPVQLRRCLPANLEQLAWELRAWFLYCVGRIGGHFGGNLEVVELSIALHYWLLYCVGRPGGHFGGNLEVVERSITLHYVLQTPEDRLVRNVGRQA